MNSSAVERCRDAGQRLERGAPGCAAAVILELQLQSDQRSRLADLAERTHRSKTDGQIRIDDPADQLVPGPGGMQPSERPGGREPHRVVRVRERVDQLVGHLSSIGGVITTPSA